MSLTDKSLELEVRESGAVAVVCVKGSVEMDEADKLQTVLEEVAEKMFAVIVLDLAGMDFICSAGLGAFIRGHLRARQRHGCLRLANPLPAVRKMLETTRLTDLLEVFDTVEDAMRA
jgi:anti-anti-sigma factor